MLQCNKLQNIKWQKRTMLLKIEMQKLGGMIMILNPKGRHLNNVLKILNIIMKKKIMWHLAGRKTRTQTSNAVTVNSVGVRPVTRHAPWLCIRQVGREIPWIGRWSVCAEKGNKWEQVYIMPTSPNIVPLLWPDCLKRLSMRKDYRKR